MINAPYWDVHTDQRDGRVSLATEALSNSPAHFANITLLKQSFASKGLSAKDLVVLSGKHTIGFGHCFGFLNRLYNFTDKGDNDPSMDPKYIAQLKKKCKPKQDLTTFVEMDPGSFRTFDDHYYTNIAKRRGFFQSDAALLDDHQTRAYVNSHVKKPYVLSFGQDLAASMVKIGAIEVLTGKAGEIRKQCGFVN
ncbi:peroxidase 27-like [Tripterygium wilfordii]|uniref:peroxidase n=1 Tax=Tripterygium wilfordii TaxID=458696 RepID=A0A7J7DUX4_TRIWF|nr:peroxidase 27-like [Tripterygium wilfordii]